MKIEIGDFRWIVGYPINEELEEASSKLDQHINFICYGDLIEINHMKYTFGDQDGLLFWTIEEQIFDTFLEAFTFITDKE